MWSISAYASEWRQKSILFFIQTVAFIIILYTTPVLGDVQQEANLIFASICGALASIVFTSLKLLILAPAKIDAIQTNKILQLKSDMEDYHFNESLMLQASAFWEEGKRLSSKNDASLDAWEQKAEAFLEKFFDASDVHRFRKSFYARDEFERRKMQLAVIDHVAQSGAFLHREPPALDATASVAPRVESILGLDKTTDFKRARKHGLENFIKEYESGSDGD